YYKGSPSTGGLRIYSFRYPFLSSEKGKYRFCKEPQNPNTIFFYPKVSGQETYIGRLFLKNTIPSSMVMTPTRRFPRMNYAYKKIWFQVVQGKLVEVFSEISSKIEIFPFYPKRILYRIRRTEIEVKNPIWHYPK
ncbi:MAG: hypothetical protein D6767_08595, partial [Candidatus Hydrogenedentota bacterium]